MRFSGFGTGSFLRTSFVVREKCRVEGLLPVETGLVVHFRGLRVGPPPPVCSGLRVPGNRRDTSNHCIDDDDGLNSPHTSTLNPESHATLQMPQEQLRSSQHQCLYPNSSK